MCSTWYGVRYGPPLPRREFNGLCTLWLGFVDGSEKQPGRRYAREADACRLVRLLLHLRRSVICMLVMANRLAVCVKQYVYTANNELSALCTRGMPIECMTRGDLLPGLLDLGDTDYSVVMEVCDNCRCRACNQCLGVAYCSKVCQNGLPTKKKHSISGWLVVTSAEEQANETKKNSVFVQPVALLLCEGERVRDVVYELPPFVRVLLCQLTHRAVFQKWHTRHHGHQVALGEPAVRRGRETAIRVTDEPGNLLEREAATQEEQFYQCVAHAVWVCRETDPPEEYPHNTAHACAGGVGGGHL